MKTEDFDRIIHATMNKCEDLLTVKAAEYATEDRLHNFKVAAEIQNCTPIQALAGMMCKHTVSVYDLCREGEHTTEMWDEKICDSINYLLLLRALVAEKAERIN